MQLTKPKRPYTSMLSERQKLILLADKSAFGWKTVEQYTQHQLADNEEDGKKDPPSRGTS